MKSEGCIGRGGSNHAPDPGLLRGVLASEAQNVERPDDDPPWDVSPVKKCEHGVVVDDDFDCRECEWANPTERRGSRRNRQVQ